MDKLILTQLYAKYRAHTLTEAERAQFRQFLNDPANEEVLHEILDEDWDAIREEELEDVSPEKAEAIFRVAINRSAKTKKLWPRIAAAASIILAVSAGGYFLLKPKQQPQQTVQNLQHDIAPGHNQATLTLANGKKIVLTKGLNGQLAVQNHTVISASRNTVTYDAHQTGDQVSYNTLSTARGEQSPYPLVLADGTKVWLNAESSITFPTAFNGNDRIVSVSGEAYFEVKHDSRKPFRVKAGLHTIEDIGTQFDVKSYNDEPAATTLLEGSVKVNHTVLKPGEQFTNDQVQAVNTSRYTAWKNGDFDFEGDNIQTIMRELSRWYSIDVAYQGNSSKIVFYAKINRAQNISVVLNALERTQGVKFQIDGRRVTVIQ